MRWIVGIAAASCLAACGGGAGHCGGPGYICRIAGIGNPQGYGAPGEPGDKTKLYFPTAVGPGPQGRIIIVDSYNWRILSVDKDDIVHTIAGDGQHHSAATDDPSTPAVESGMDVPDDFAFDKSGDLIYVSHDDARVVKLHDGYLYLVAGTGVGIDKGDGGPAKLAQFSHQEGIAIGKDGSIYVADDTRVRVITPDGIIHAFAGTGTQGHSGDGGPAVDAELDQPMAVAVGPDGSVYIAEGNDVRKVDPSGTISTVAGNGQHGFSGDGGPATQAELAYPEGVAVAPDGTLYISDTYNNRIRKVDTNGIITTIAGTGNAGLAGDGELAIDSSLQLPARLKLSGNALYFGDMGNGCARVIYLQ